MNKDEFESIASRLREINDVVTDLDETIRSQAFTILKSYVDAPSPKVGEGHRRSASESGSDQEEHEAIVDTDAAAAFLEKYVSDRPSDNVKAIVAFIYSIYGNEDFTANEVNEIAHETGVVVPDRVDVTLSGASVDKKQLFNKRKSGVYRPTIHGRKFFKDEYGVSPGTAKRPDLT